MGLCIQNSGYSRAAPSGYSSPSYPYMIFTLWCLTGYIVGIVFASFFEWTLHKYVMHRPVGKFRYAFQAHAILSPDPRER
jgi:hypothetical protein